jgi:subtilase family serine protease
MNRTRLSAFAAIAAIAITAACSGGHGGGSFIAAPSASPASAGFVDNSQSIPPQLQIAQWGRKLIQTSSYVGPSSNGALAVEVLVHQQNAQGLIAYAQSANTPGSANYQRWLTPQQIGQTYGAKLSDYQTVANYFASQGLSVAAWPQHMMLEVTGPQSAMEHAFNTKFGTFQRNGRTFLAPQSVPYFSTPLPVDAVGRIVAYDARHTYLMYPPRAGSALINGYSPQQVRAAFDLNGAINNRIDGTGVTMAVIATGPINTAAGAAGNACNFRGATSIVSGDKDLAALRGIYNFTAANVYEQCVTATGVAAGLAASRIAMPAPGQSSLPGNEGFPYSNSFATPPPVTASCAGLLPGCNPEDGEAQLDVQQEASLAPGAQLFFYLAYNSSDCNNVLFPNSCPTSGSNAGAPLIGIDESDAEIQQVIADNKADIISMSFGLGEPDAFSTLADYTGSYSQLEFAALAAEGISAFASSGDSGSAECTRGDTYEAEQCVSYPAGDPNVTSVGGVTAYLDPFGNIFSPMLGWGISTGNNGYGGVSQPGGASGGGTSLIQPAPSPQTSGIGATMREQPDVSMIGDPATGVAFYTNAGFTGAGVGDIGGTSVASPEMAAIWALVESACVMNPGQGMCPSSTHRLGNPAPILYKIYSGSNYHNIFYDVLYGDNQMSYPGTTAAQPIPGAAAMSGYDQITGIGVPFAGHLINAIAGTSLP